LLKKVLDIILSKTNKNDEVYVGSKTFPLEKTIQKHKWKIFGKVLLIYSEKLAKYWMINYYERELPK